MSSLPFGNPAQATLASAYANLRNARNAPEQKQALKFCMAAKKELDRIKGSAGFAYRDQIIAAYREHSRVLKRLGHFGEATRSCNIADELERGIPGAQGRSSSLVPPGVSSIGQSVLVSSSSNNIHGHGLEIVPASIFAKDFHPQLFKGVPPKPDEQLINTHQLAYCLALLQASPSPDDSIDETTRTWLQNTKANEDEQERLKTMATDLLLQFMRDGLKDEKTTAEIAFIAPVLESDNFRSLLGIFVDSLKSSAFLPVHALEGLDRVIQCAPPGSMDPDDLIKILEYLTSCLQDTNTQSLDHVYQLTRTASHILDAMVDGEIKDLGREKLHAPLLLYLKELKRSTDPYMVFQAAYASQALLRVPNNEKPWQTGLRHTGTVVRGTARLFSAVKSFDVDKFIDTTQGGLEVAGKILGEVGATYKDFSALKKSGQELQVALKSSFNSKRNWYPMLRGIDTLLRNGELTKVKTVICDAPCRRELAFQWGVCQRLGNLAADPMWDADSREGAVAFLGEIYRNDAVWGKEAKVKQCILDILMQLAVTSGSAKQAANRLLQEFENDADVRKKTLYTACRKEGPSSQLWKIALPLPSSSPLLDCVQKTPAVEADLRRLGRIRLQDLGDTIYIPPEAKAHRKATNHDLFDLMTKTKEFLGSKKKVLLIWGDSGAGKSTFNKELERELWDDYNSCKDRNLRKVEKIPIFVSLPAIDKPGSDLISMQLWKAHFNNAQIQELKANREFVLICDGYDEYQQMRNLYNINQLNRPGQWKAQMVISCRSEYLGSDYRYLFRPEDRNSQMGEALLQEAAIAPFSKEQIRAYIEKYAAKEASQREGKKTSQWEVKEYLQVFDKTPSLQELVTNPFLLTLSLRVLPGMADLQSYNKVTRVMLYDRFLEQWVENGKERLIKRELTGDDKKAFETLCDDSFSQNAILFVKELAVAIFKNQDGTPVVEYVHNRKKVSWKTDFFGRDDDKKLLREACPLRRDGNQYRFIHRSVLEYAMARAIFEPRQREEYDTGGQEMTATAGGRNEHQEEEKDVLVATVSAPDVNSPLFWKSFVKKPAVLQFLAERVPQEPAFRQQLHDYIEYSKTDEKWRIAAANAITVLIRARVRFNGADLESIRIPGADLSGGEFDSARLQGANLRNVNLRNIWLRHANLSDAWMSGAQFGEWPYLKHRMAKGNRMTCSVCCCAYSPDGKTFTVGLVDGKVDVYDTTTWVKIYTLHGDPNRVRSVTYSPCGGQIALGGNEVRLWDVKADAPGHVLRGHTNDVYSVTYSPEGRQIASGSADKTVRLWDAQTGVPGLILNGHTDGVTSVKYSPSGSQIASGSDDKTVRLWDAQTGAPGLTLSGHTKRVTSVTFSPSGHQIASGSYDRTVRLWDAQTGAPSLILGGHIEPVDSMRHPPGDHQIVSGSGNSTSGLSLGGHTSYVYSVAYSPSGHQIASGSEDKTVRLWDTQTGALGRILSGHTDYVSSVTYSPSNHQIASGSSDGTVRLWDVQLNAPDTIFSGHSEVVTSVTYSPSGHQIASGSWDRTVRLWDAQTGAPGLILSGHIASVTSVTYSPSGGQIASGSDDKTVRLWDAQTGAPGLILRGHTNCVTSVTFSPRGHQIASGSYDSTVRLWDTQTGALNLTLSGHTQTVNSVAYSPNGLQIASGSLDKTVRLWDTQTGEVCAVLGGRIEVISSVEYSSSNHQIPSTGATNLSFGGLTLSTGPDGLQIISQRLDKTTRVWNVQLDGPGAILEFPSEFSPILYSHTGEGTSVTYSPSGHQVVSGSECGKLLLWDAQTGTPGPTLSGHAGKVTGVAYSPGGHHIVSGGIDGSVRLWDVDSGQCLEVVTDIGRVRGVAWNATLNGTYFATCCGNSVRTWKVMKEDGHFQVHLHWSSMNDRLHLVDTLIQNARGLSSVNTQLLKQRDAVGDPIQP